MVHFAEINQAPPPYSMLQYIGRVATPKLVPRYCLRYLQTTLKIKGGGLLSEFMWGIVRIVLNLPGLAKIESLLDHSIAWSDSKASSFSTPSRLLEIEIIVLSPVRLCKSTSITHSNKSFWKILKESA